MIYTFYLATGQAPMSSPVIEMMGVHIFNEICIILYIREHTKALVCPCSLMSLIVPVAWFEASVACRCDNLTFGQPCDAASVLDIVKIILTLMLLVAKLSNTK